MSISGIGMGVQADSVRQEFENEVNTVIDAGNRAGILLRVLGAVAFHMHCPRVGHLQAAMGRAYTDIDFAAYSEQSKEIRALLTRMGYIEDPEVYVISEGRRSILEKAGDHLHIDVFYNELDFCHPINWKGRLEKDSPTIPLAELLLEKMQIVKINEKDVIDTIMLLLEHPLGDNDSEVINMDWVARLCAADWGLWRTVTMNLDKVRRLAPGYSLLTEAQNGQVASQVNAALARIEAEPKPMAWRMRARVGDRVKWYKEVEEVE